MMNTRSMTRTAAGIAAVGLAAGMLAGCSADNGDTPQEPGGDAEQITLTWWHNATSDPLQGLWEDVAAEFEAMHEGLTIEVTGYQNEDLQRTLIPNALVSGNAPDVFMVWPGGEVRSQAEAGHLRDLSSLTDTIDALGASVNPWQLDGVQYGLPYTFGATGIWYNTEQYAEAGITAPPTTLAELEDAVAKLQAAGFTPFSVGAGDGWPAGHWWYQFAIGACGQAVLQTAIPELDFSDPCWVTAGEQLEAFVASDPFNSGFLATPLRPAPTAPRASSPTATPRPSSWARGTRASSDRSRRTRPCRSGSAGIPSPPPAATPS
ncbi:extracellular solute-binding protein [Microbacterium sp. NIBRBAC000506063]|nr:extracellular solute-binding protein [Microbacterium sp. NIBRBAC000506063]QTV80338.1 extracellular solute-binding protein [Microbacterium sp. NIBRBAC000506063]